MKPDWVINEIKYNRAVSEAKNPSDEKEVKAIYVSYGGLLTNVIVENETMNEEEIIETTPEVVEETEEEIAPEVIEEVVVESEVIHTANDIPSASDEDHYAEISNIEYISETNQTTFYLEDYYLNPDGTKVMKGGQQKSFEGLFSPEQVVEKAQTDLIEPSWNIKVVLK